MCSFRMSHRRDGGVRVTVLSHVMSRAGLAYYVATMVQSWTLQFERRLGGRVRGGAELRVHAGDSERAC